FRNGIACILSDKFSHGSEHAVFEIVFEDQCIWICRARRRDLEESPHYLKMTMDSTVACMLYVRQNTSVPVPKIYDYQSDPSATSIGACYMFMEPIYGKKRDQFREVMTSDERRKLYYEIADSAVQLTRLDFPKIGLIYQPVKGCFEI